MSVETGNSMRIVLFMSTFTRKCPIRCMLGIYAIIRLA